VKREREEEEEEEEEEESCVFRFVFVFMLLLCGTSSPHPSLGSSYSRVCASALIMLVVSLCLFSRSFELITYHLIIRLMKALYIRYYLSYRVAKQEARKARSFKKHIERSL
jgi:predicted membrane protein